MATPETISLSNEQILYHVRRILDHALLPDMQKLMILQRNEYMKKLTLEHELLCQNYPAIFFAIIDDPKNFNVNRLKELLEQRRRLQNKEITKDDADKQIGQKYFDEYIQPKLNK